MKKRAGIIILLVLIAATSFCQNTATINRVVGKVELRLPEDTVWRKVSEGMQFPLRSTISTGFGSMAVLDLGRSAIEVKQLTRMRVDELFEQEETVSTKLYLNVGRVRAKVKEVDNLNHDFSFITTQSVASVRGTDFEFDGKTLICYEGVVLLANKLRQERAIVAGESSVSEVYEVPITPIKIVKAESEVETAQTVSEEQAATQEISAMVETVSTTVKINTVPPAEPQSPDCTVTAILEWLD